MKTNSLKAKRYEISKSYDEPGIETDIHIDPEKNQLEKIKDLRNPDITNREVIYN
jgi:hypothetical protein